MRNSDLLIGAFWRTTYFDDVVISPTDPPTSFTLTKDGMFPASLLNNTQPGTHPVGTAGTDGINRQVKFSMRSMPEFDQPDKSIEDDGINGNSVFVRIRSVPTGLRVKLRLPHIDPTHADYDNTWEFMQHLAHRKVLIYGMGRWFAFRGYLASAPGLFLGAPYDGSIACQFKIDYFYRCEVESAIKSYQLLGFS